MKYSARLIRDCQGYAKTDLKIISEETAEWYLDSYADLYDLMAESIKGNLNSFSG
jgi:hypothetical protein